MSENATFSFFPVQVERKEGWRLAVFSRWKETFRHIDEVFDILHNPVNIIQQNNRGIVSLIQHQNNLFVAKRSLLQEKRRWTQFTSIYRKGEGSRTLHYMAKMLAAGIPVPEPVLMLEKSTFGCVVASWSVYCYVEGTPCDCSQSHLAAMALREMHQKHWVHRDVHIQNFLLQGEDIYIIDCSKARPWSFKYAQMYDVVRFNNCCPGSVKQYGISESYWVYRFAKFHNNSIKLWRSIKRKIRIFIGRLPKFS